MLVHKGYDNHNCHNKPQIGNEAGVWITLCPEAMVLRIWEFWKRVSWDRTMKAESWVSAIEARVGFWLLKDEVGFFRSLPTEILDITRCTVHWDGVSIVRIVSLSPRVMAEVKKLINRSYLKQQSLPVFCICVVIDIIMAVVCNTGSNGNEGVLCITKSSNITGTSPSDCLVS